VYWMCIVWVCVGVAVLGGCGGCAEGGAGDGDAAGAPPHHPTLDTTEDAKVPPSSAPPPHSLPSSPPRNRSIPIFSPFSFSFCFGPGRRSPFLFFFFFFLFPLSGQAVHLIMELCEGGELFDRIQEKGHYSESKAARVCRHLIEVLGHCHGHGILHRDLKPENILLTSKKSDTRIKVIDYGMAYIFKPGQAHYPPSTLPCSGSPSPPIHQQCTMQLSILYSPL